MTQEKEQKVKEYYQSQGVSGVKNWDWDSLSDTIKKQWEGYYDNDSCSTGLRQEPELTEEKRIYPNILMPDGKVIANPEYWLPKIAPHGIPELTDIAKEIITNPECGASHPSLPEVNKQRDQFLIDIQLVFDDLFSLLSAKNLKYGDSALSPLGIFAKGDPISLINVRIDDKLARISSNTGQEDEDVELDLIGYLILKRIAIHRSKIQTYKQP